MKKLKAELSNRKGFTLILSVLLMTVFIGAAAFAIDIGHMYLLRSDVHASSDAAALAGISKYAVSADTVAARTEAQGFAARFRADTVALSLAGVDFVFGKWSPPSGSLASFTAGATPINAVKTTVRYTGGYFAFGKYLGFSTHQVTATSIAVHGSVGSTECMRPLGIPYQSLLDVLYPPANTKPVTYDLTAADIVNLNQLATPTVLKLGSPGGTNPGQFYAVDLPVGEYADGTAPPTNPITGANQYRTLLGSSCSVNAAQGGTVSVGDWLNPESGNVVGPTGQGVDDFCALFTCPSKAIVALWSTLGNAPGGHCNACYHIKYLGVFNIIGFDKPSQQVTGNFTGLLNAAGGFSGTPGPIQKNALVY
jgi:Flp pilus assembly protein TadG